MPPGPTACMSSVQLNIEHHDHKRESRHAVVPMAANDSRRPVDPHRGGDAAAGKVHCASNAGTRNSRRLNGFPIATQKDSRWKPSKRNLAAMC